MLRISISMRFRGAQRVMGRRRHRFPGYARTRLGWWLE